MLCERADEMTEKRQDWEGQGWANFNGTSTSCIVMTLNFSRSKTRYLKLKKKINCRLFPEMNHVASGEVPPGVLNQFSISHER